MAVPAQHYVELVSFGVAAFACGKAGLKLICLMQRYFGTAIGKGRQAAKTEVERLKLGEISCEQGVTEIAKMCVQALPTPWNQPRFSFHLLPITMKFPNEDALQ